MRMGRDVTLAANLFLKHMTPSIPGPHITVGSFSSSYWIRILLYWSVMVRVRTPRVLRRLETDIADLWRHASDCDVTERMSELQG